MMTLLN